MQGSTPVDCEVLNVIQGAGIWPDCNDKTQLLQAINTLISGGGSGGGNTVIIGSEIGTVSAFAMPTAPDGWLVCDGSPVSRTEYADLLATIGTVWGHGDEITTFNLPDLRGEFIRGFDDGRDVDSGRVFGSLQTDDIKQHAHPNNGQTGPINSHGSTYPYRVAIAGSGTFAAGDTGVFGGDETRPRNIAMTYAIKAFYPSAS
ncbi:phage tail protein [Thalassospira lucentensis]|uniref:phage tail protein n=1 Tax=Thalassospira lucentensis TaxID=168935 RepID=UPI003D2E4C76|tara:strand:- start:154 stop:759 length:606 start_codon:yes stop_codon:yes gene_type:complete